MPRERRSGSSSTPKKEKASKEQPGLRDLVQRRLIKDVFHRTAELQDGWMVLVVDNPAMRVLSSAVGMYDIMEQKVTVVEDINKKRAPFTDMGVIYLLNCNEDSVNRLVADWSDKPMYGNSVYIYFLNRMSDKLFEKIKECRPLVKRIKALSEVNCDFLAKELRAFHLDMRNAFQPLYVRNKRSKIENRIAEKLVTLMATMNELPHVRYTRESPSASTLAKTFHVKMEQFARNNHEFWYNGDTAHNERDRGVLLILDRRDDCLTPLMHDFTYQSMANDLLPMKEDQISYRPDDNDDDDDDDDDDDEEEEERVKAKGPGSMEVLLNETDKIWVELRGKHIAAVIQILSARIQEMLNSDTHTFGGNGEGKTMSLSQMSAALKALPEYKEVISKLSQHMHLAHDCMDKFSAHNLLELSELEQTLATGKTEDGASPKIEQLIDATEKMLATLKKPGDKLRLLLILIVSRNGVKPADKQRLWGAARITSDQQKVLDNLCDHLDVPIYKAEDAAANKNVLAGWFGKQNSGGDNLDEDSEFANSRYVPPMKKILEAMVQNKLSFEDYPSVVAMPEQVGGSTGVAHSARKRRETKGSATSKWQRAAPKGDGKAGDYFEGGRIIVFMIGGMSFAEIRVSREVQDKENREVVAGSTCFIKATEFIEDIGSL